MYLIPKNIKVKREIFKGFGIIEIIALAISLGIGYLLSFLGNGFQIKCILFFFLPILVFMLLIPLPNGGTSFKLVLKFVRYQRRQKKYKLK